MTYVDKVIAEYISVANKKELKSFKKKLKYIEEAIDDTLEFKKYNGEEK